MLLTGPPCWTAAPTLNNLMDRDILPPTCHQDESTASPAKIAFLGNIVFVD